MNRIFLIDEGKMASADAMKFAEQLAWTTGCQLTVASPRARAKAPALASAGTVNHFFAPYAEPELPHCTVDISGMSAQQLIQQIAARGASVVIKGYDLVSGRGLKTDNSLQTLLSGLTAPVWLVPSGCRPIAPRHLAYITDLRYCRNDVLERVLQLTAPGAARVSVIHLAAPGLPDLSADFAKALFKKTCETVSDGQRLAFQHIQEAALATIADVLINGLMIDGLVMANRSPHFNDLSPAITELTTGGDMIRPLLLFPG